MTTISCPNRSCSTRGALTNIQNMRRHLAHNDRCVQSINHGWLVRARAEQCAGCHMPFRNMTLHVRSCTATAPATAPGAPTPASSILWRRPGTGNQHHPPPPPPLRPVPHSRPHPPPIRPTPTATSRPSATPPTIGVRDFAHANQAQGGNPFSRDFGGIHVADHDSSDRATRRPAEQQDANSGGDANSDTARPPRSRISETPPTSPRWREIADRTSSPSPPPRSTPTAMLYGMRENVEIVTSSARPRPHHHVHHQHLNTTMHSRIT